MVEVAGRAACLRDWRPGDYPPIPTASFPKVDDVEIAAEVLVVRSALLSLDQADHRKIIRELAGRVVALLARFGFESLKVLHPHGARQAGLRDVRHAECEFGGDKTVQGFDVFAEDGIIELLFELAGLLGELRIDIGRRGQLTHRTLLLSCGNSTDQ